MPSKLKDLKITRVDFVDAGANPEANILLFKNKEGAPAAKTTEPSSFAKGGEKSESAIKKFFTAIAKALGLQDESVDQAIEEIAKGYEAATFDEKMDEQKRRRVTSEIWDVCYALEESLCSIICDDDVDESDKPDLMDQSLNEFSEAVKVLIPTWAQGKIASKINKAERPLTLARLEEVKTAKAKLDAIIAKADEPVDLEEDCKPKTPKTTKGDSEDMRIDKSKLTPEELAALEAIEKKAGIQDDNNPAPAGDPVAKGADKNPPIPAGNEPDDIYKGLHPAIKTELESLRKFREAAEDRELHEVAKKYEIIGKKADELVPTLKSLKAAGGDAYDQMIAVLDASVEAFEKSGIFSEIGKKGSSSADAWTLLEKHADEIQKSAPNLTRTQAIDKACDQHPELVAEYENNR